MGPRLKNFYKTLAKFQKIALDSSCFIYQIEENPKYLELTKIIFEELLPQNKIEAIASTLIIAEILTKPYSMNRRDLVLDYKDLILNLPQYFPLISVIGRKYNDGSDTNDKNCSCMGAF